MLQKNLFVFLVGACVLVFVPKVEAHHHMWDGGAPVSRFREMQKISKRALRRHKKQQKKRQKRTHAKELKEGNPGGVSDELLELYCKRYKN